MGEQDIKKEGTNNKRDKKSHISVLIGSYKVKTKSLRVFRLEKNPS